MFAETSCAETCLAESCFAEILCRFGYRFSETATILLDLQWLGQHATIIKR
jgi:hypothetical protein